MPTSDIRTPDVENLLEVLAAIDDKDTLFALMEDMFTIREIRERVRSVWLLPACSMMASRMPRSNRRLVPLPQPSRAFPNA